MKLKLHQIKKQKNKLKIKKKKIIKFKLKITPHNNKMMNK